MSSGPSLPSLPPLHTHPNTLTQPLSPGLDLYPPTPDPHAPTPTPQPPPPQPSLPPPATKLSSYPRVQQHRLREKRRLEDAKAILTSMVKSISFLPSQGDIDYKAHYLVLASEINRLKNVMLIKRYDPSIAAPVLPDLIPQPAHTAEDSSLQNFFDNILPPTPLNNQ